MLLGRAGLKFQDNIKVNLKEIGSGNVLDSFDPFEEQVVSCCQHEKDLRRP